MAYDNLTHIKKSSLLKLKLRDINVSFEDSEYAVELKKIHQELENKKLKIKPLIWGSDDWFCPDGHTSFAVPFTLFHPRLREMEAEYVKEVEGSDLDEFRKLARHECGHVLDNAFNLRSIAGRSELFGDFQIPYPTEYNAKKHSKKYVIHLKENYAQAHPEEDWAETFAVWLDPHSAWEKKYQKWSALKKLEYMNSVMKSLASKRALVRNDLYLDHFRSFDVTLGEYLAMKRRSNKKRFKLSFYDDLITSDMCLNSSDELCVYLKKYHKQILDEVALKTKLKKYDLNYALIDLELNAREKGLRIIKKGNRVKVLSTLVQRYSADYLKDGKHRIIM